MTSIPNLRSAGQPRTVGGTPESNVQRGGSRVINALDRVTSRGYDIEQIMSDLRVGSPIREALQPLTEVGFTLQDVLVVGEFDQKERWITTLTRAAELHYLLQLPAIVVHNETQDNINLIAALNLILPSGSEVYLLVHRVDAIPITFDSIVKAYNRMRARFVPSLHICGKDGKSILPLGSLLAAFELSREQTSAAAPHTGPLAAGTGAPQVALPTPRRSISDAELNLIASNFAELIYRPEGSQILFNDFISRLEFRPSSVTAARAQWDIDLTLAARKLVYWANSRGRHMLGRLVGQLLEDAPGRDDAGKILNIANDCGLISPDRFGSLQHQIDEEMNPS